MVIIFSFFFEGDAIYFWEQIVESRRQEVARRDEAVCLPLVRRTGPTIFSLCTGKILGKKMVLGEKRVWTGNFTLLLPANENASVPQSHCFVCVNKRKQRRKWM